MAAVNIVDYPPIITDSVRSADRINADVSEKKYQAVISEKNIQTKSIKKSHYAISKISYRSRRVKINQILPFYVKFENIIGGYSKSNPAPIGIAVIGFNNYIL